MSMLTCDAMTTFVPKPGLADCGGCARAVGVAEGGAGLAWTGADGVWGAGTGAEPDIGGWDNIARRACNRGYIVLKMLFR